MNDKQLQLILGKLETLASQGVQVGADIVHFNAIGDLMSGGALAIIGIIGIIVFITGQRKYEDDVCEGIPHMVFGGATAVIGLMFFLISFLNIWNWVALSDPKLALAKQILEKVLSQ